MVAFRSVLCPQSSEKREEHVGKPDAIKPNLGKED